MSPPKKPRESANTSLVRELALLLDETNLTEIEVDDGELRIRVARTPAATAAVAPSPFVQLTAEPAPGTTPPRDDNALLSHPGLITSPMVGVAYTTAEPSAPPFVNVGDTVTEGTTLLLIEAMKVFNPITAPRAGRVTQVLVSNGSPVEFGEPLLVIE